MVSGRLRGRKPYKGIAPDSPDLWWQGPQKLRKVIVIYSPKGAQGWSGEGFTAACEGNGTRAVFVYKAGCDEAENLVYLEDMVHVY